MSSHVSNTIAFPFSPQGLSNATALASQLGLTRYEFLVDSGDGHGYIRFNTQTPLLFETLDKLTASWSIYAWQEATALGWGSIRKSGEVTTNSVEDIEYQLIEPPKKEPYYVYAGKFAAFLLNHF